MRILDYAVLNRAGVAAIDDLTNRSIFACWIYRLMRMGLSPMLTYDSGCLSHRGKSKRLNLISTFSKQDHLYVT